MLRLFPPIIPGLTEGAEGAEQNKTLYALVTLEKRKPQLFPTPIGDAIKQARPLFTPQDPPPEPVLRMPDFPAGRASDY